MFDDRIPDLWNLLRRPPHWVMSGLSDRVVTIRVDAEAFNDLGTMHRLTEEALGRLGCPACHSGFDIRYLLERDFVVGPEGTLAPVRHF